MNCVRYFIPNWGKSFLLKRFGIESHIAWNSLVISRKFTPIAIEIFKSATQI